MSKQQVSETGSLSLLPNSLPPPEQQPSSAPPPTATTARMAGEERRQQILRVAMSLFSQHGFRGTTTREIARSAGVSEAMVFRHFATKEELYSAILDHKACGSGVVMEPRELLHDAIERKDDRAVFEELAKAMMCYHERDLEFMRLLTHSALEGHQLREMFWDRSVRPMYEFLGAYIRERQRDGAMREVDPLIAVRAFLGMIIHHSLNNTLWDQPRRLLNVTNERAAREFTEILLRGLAADAQHQPPGGGSRRHVRRKSSAAAARASAATGATPAAAANRNKTNKKK